MTLIRFIDLRAQYAALKTEIDAKIQDVLSSAQFIGAASVFCDITRAICYSNPEGLRLGGAGAEVDRTF